MISYRATNRNDQILLDYHSQCSLCGSRGKLLYRNLVDRLFDSPGRWNLKQCENKRCKLVWLDPMPQSEDIEKAYSNYYTHLSETNPGSLIFIKRLYHIIKRAYIGSKFGYSSPAPKIVGKFLSFICIGWKSEAEAEVRCLPFIPGGRVLDVGCGHGEWLVKMREMGWETEGVDFDKKAVILARARGLKMRVGTLSSQNYAENFFDAVTLNHMIEHVPDPIDLLQECRRVLKPGGRLVLSTPNIESLGHWLFKENWRGLEPPRHLYLFCSLSIRTVLLSAGFTKISIRTLKSKHILGDSLRLWTRRYGNKEGQFSRFTMAVIVRILYYLEQGMILANLDTGENLFVEAVKN